VKLLASGCSFKNNALEEEEVWFELELINLPTSAIMIDCEHLFNLRCKLLLAIIGPCCCGWCCECCDYMVQLLQLYNV